MWPAVVVAAEGAGCAGVSGCCGVWWLVDAAGGENGVRRWSRSLLLGLLLLFLILLLSYAGYLRIYSPSIFVLLTFFSSRAFAKKECVVFYSDTAIRSPEFLYIFVDMRQYGCIKSDQSETGGHSHGCIKPP